MIHSCIHISNVTPESQPYTIYRAGRPRETPTPFLLLRFFTCESTGDSRALFGSWGSRDLWFAVSWKKFSWGLTASHVWRNLPKKRTSTAKKLKASRSFEKFQRLRILLSIMLAIKLKYNACHQILFGLLIGLTFPSHVFLAATCW